MADRIDQEIGPKTDGVTVIAHISDLHFSPDTTGTEEIFQALVDDIADHKVDVVVVTGDVVDSSIPDNIGTGKVERAYDNVAAYLKKLCARAKVDEQKCLFVVPGNHDVRVSGFMGFRKSHADKFYRTFQQVCSDCFFPQLRLALFCFNSNAADVKPNFGNGRVDVKDLLKFSATAKNYAEANPEAWNRSTRVALVHHHAMPIPGTEHRGKWIDHEWLIIFRNAGMFLRQMLEHEVALVLHGHKHYHAHSRASFPISQQGERSLAVVGAGSVGKTAPQNPSYNLIEVTMDGAITLHRRERETVGYHPVAPVSLVAYENVRRHTIARLAQLPKAKLAIRKVTSTYEIIDRVGDFHAEHAYDGVQSLSRAPVRELGFTLGSTGRFHAADVVSETPGQLVEWEWKKQEPNSPSREVCIRFDPAVGSAPIRYVRRMKAFNSFFFNEKDRLDAAPKSGGREWLEVKSDQVVQSLFVHLIFPERRMPTDIILKVFDENGRENECEREFVARSLVLVPKSHSLIFSLEHPLPGYEYRIVWALPRDEAEQLQLTAPEAGMAERLIQDLLKLRADVGRPIEERPGQQALAALRTTMVESKLFSGLSNDPSFEISLFVLDKDKHRLVCACALVNSRPESRLWRWEIKVGETVTGRAYRRREPLLWFRVPGVTVKDDEIYEDFSADPEHHIPDHTVILAVPLFYPPQSGRIVAVLNFASREGGSELLRLEEEARLAALVEQSIIWYSTALAAALNHEAFSLEEDAE